MSDTANITPFKNPERVDMVAELTAMLELARQGSVTGYVACFTIGDEFEIRSTAAPLEALAMAAMQMHKFNEDLLA